MVKLLQFLGLVLGIIASICEILFTYYQYCKSKKDQGKGPSDAATSNEPVDGCRKDNL